MSAKYWQKGETLDYTATAAVQNGDVVSLNTRIGVAGNDIAAGETGAVHVVGVFEIPKAAVAIDLGAAVYWDADNQQITTTQAGNIPAGYAVAAAGANDDAALVKLLG
jgi:predicted RecA/RadA family phage recombinase